MPIYKLTLREQRAVANNTLQFIFEKPDGFTFIPGQYGGFTLINPAETDAKGNTRRFSLLSTPDDDTVVIAMRTQTSAFKRSLAAMKPGDEIKFAGPTGNFVLHQDTSIPAVMIAGGIGITPFYSMIKHATKHTPNHAIHLFYGNQTRDDAAFLQELKNLSRGNFKLVAALANPDSTWDGETGFITHTLIKKYITDIHAPIYYVCGSPAMVNAIHELLLEMGIRDDKIRVEDFPGY